MAEYIDRHAFEKALSIAAACGKDKDCRVWAKLFAHCTTCPPQTLPQCGTGVGLRGITCFRILITHVPLAAKISTWKKPGIRR